jgi:hypothetical protein
MTVDHVTDLQDEDEQRHSQFDREVVHPQR